MKVAVDAGHGRYTAGKRSPAGEREWMFNDLVVRALIAELKNYSNVSVLRVDDPTGNTDVPLSTRAARANAFGADVYVSVHHNANTGKWGTWTGSETFVMSGSTQASGSMKLARAVHPQLVRAMGLKDRGIKAANFAVLRETKMPAILTEGGYMDSSIDIVKMRDAGVMQRQGAYIAQGIATYGGLTRTGTPVQVAAPRDYLQRGDTGKDVEDLQRKLAVVGFGVGVTGIYDVSTYNAVSIFQGRVGILKDGLYGKQTERLLDAKVAEYQAKAPVTPAPTPVEEAKPVANDGKFDSPSKSLKPEFDEAVKEGITDGTYPNRTATRAEVAVMIIRAVKLLRK